MIESPARRLASLLNSPDSSVKPSMNYIYKTFPMIKAGERTKQTTDSCQQKKHPIIIAPTKANTASNMGPRLSVLTPFIIDVSWAIVFVRTPVE